jgi:hypothetical protein
MRADADAERLFAGVVGVALVCIWIIVAASVIAALIGRPQ